MAKLKIGLVGPCKAGKTTLKNNLSNYGLNIKHIAQEHSGVPDMWRRLSDPDVLIYLDVSVENAIIRGQNQIHITEFTKQLNRLEHARKSADFYIDTNEITEKEVASLVINFLNLEESPE